MCAAVPVLRRIHLALGIFALIAFIATGQYMDLRWAHLRGMADGPRLLFRSAHIYLLFSGLLNLVFGLYASASAPRGARRALQVLGSALVLTGPFLFIAAFFREPWLVGLVRPFARAGIYASTAGVLLHLPAAFLGRVE
jgi:hypothetical protein